MASIPLPLAAVLANIWSMKAVLICLFGAAMALTTSLEAAGSTHPAFKVRDMAAKGSNSALKEKLIAMRGVKSTVSLQPIEWYVWFFDGSAKQQGKRVKISGESVVEIMEGHTELERARLASYKEDEILPPKALQVDSDEAYSRVSSAAGLKNAKVTSVEYDLRRRDGLPVWLMNFYSEKKGESVKVATARVSALDGQVLELKVHSTK